MKNVSKAAMIAAKILELLHWIGGIVMIGLLVCTFAAKDWLVNLIGSSILEGDTMLKVYGFEIAGADGNGTVLMSAVTMFSIAGALILPLMAMILRNVYLIIKKSESGTPFQKDNLRMVKEIGIFYILIPLISLTLSYIARLFVGVDFTETSADFDGFITGIVVLCLTQVFARGIELEKDVDGLL